jgi:hypothetical protein
MQGTVKNKKQACREQLEQETGMQGAVITRNRHAGKNRTRNWHAGNSKNKKHACREQLEQETCIQGTVRTRYRHAGNS